MMKIFDLFITIFIGTLLFEIVAKTMVNLYLDIKEKFNKK